MSTTGETRRRPASGSTLVLLVLLAVLVLAYVVWTLPGVRPQPGFDKRFDGLLQGAAYSVAALLAVVGAWQRRTAGVVSWCVVAFLVLRAIGFDISLTTLALGRVPTYPSWADAAWVLSSLLLVAALAIRVSHLTHRRTPLVALDAVSASLVALGLAINALAGPIDTLTAPGVPRGAVVMNILYPVLDVAVLIAVAALLTTARNRLTPSDLVLLGGSLGLVVVDVTYFVLLAEGEWRPGTLLAALSVVSTAVVAVAVALAAVVSQRAVEPVRRTGELPAADLASGIVVPATLIGLLVVVLALSGYAIPAVGPALLCYAVGGALAITRGLLTLRSIQLEARRVLGAASGDLRLFKSLVDASGELIGMSDDSGRVLYLNPAGRRMLRIPDSVDVTTLHVSLLVPDLVPERFGARWPMLLEARRFSGDAEVVPVDGSPNVPVDVSTFVVEDSGTDGAVVVATIQRDISERLRNERAVRDLADQRARLLQRLVQAQEDERARIAGDVHDDPVQALAAVDLRLGLLRRRLSKEAPEMTADVATLQDIVATATSRLRNLLFDLESLPEGASLSEAIDEAAGFIFTGTDVETAVEGETDLPLPEAERVIILRVVKEALTNARKHAQASRVVVRLELVDGDAVVTVDDDGRGIEPGQEQDRPGHLGLAGMRDRAQVAGAVLEVGRRPEGGTRVRLALPLSRVGTSRPLSR